MDFFVPLNEWFKQYINEIGGPVTLNTKINYLNTSSSKCIFNFLEILKEYHKAGSAVQVNWHYEEDDEDMMETGEELCEDLNYLIN